MEILFLVLSIYFSINLVMVLAANLFERMTFKDTLIMFFAGLVLLIQIGFSTRD